MVARCDVVLVARARGYAGDEALPDARSVTAPREQMTRAIPAVEVAEDRDAFCVGRPDRKRGARFTAVVARMRAELLVEPSVRPFAKEIYVVIRERSGCGQRTNASAEYRFSHGSPLLRNTEESRAARRRCACHRCKNYKPALPHTDWAFCNSWRWKRRNSPSSPLDRMPDR